jgi:hypothetical protein
MEGTEERTVRMMGKEWKQRKIYSYRSGEEY